MGGSKKIEKGRLFSGGKRIWEILKRDFPNQKVKNGKMEEGMGKPCF